MDRFKRGRGGRHSFQPGCCIFCSQNRMPFLRRNNNNRTRAKLRLRGCEKVQFNRNKFIRKWKTSQILTEVQLSWRHSRSSLRNQWHVVVVSNDTMVSWNSCICIFSLFFIIHFGRHMLRLKIKPTFKFISCGERAQVRVFGIRKKL